MDSIEEFSVTQAEAMKMKGITSRTTLFEWRRAGLPFKRDKRTGQIFFRQSDLETYDKRR